MRQISLILILTAVFAGCAGPRLSNDEARRRIAEIGSSGLVPNAIEIRRIVTQTEDQAIAESTVALAFQFRKEGDTGEWRIESVRLGDRTWIQLEELLAAVNDGRQRETRSLLEKLAAGITEYHNRNGSLPDAHDIAGLTDVLHPLYMNELIRLDAWGNPIGYEVRGPAAFRLISDGADGHWDTDDDIVVGESGPLSP